MIKKIYSAVEADEVQAMLVNGYSVHGYVGETLDEVISKSMKWNPLDKIKCIKDSNFEKRFIRCFDSKAFGLFGVVSVIEEIDVTNREVML